MFHAGLNAGCQYTSTLLRDISFTVPKFIEDSRYIAVVTKPQHVAESPGGLINTDCEAPRTEFLIQ